jgi:hypothetical protein
MLIQPCPLCARSAPRLLDECNKVAWVTYYRCDGCAHIWTASKTTGVINNHITSQGTPA